MPFEAFSRGQLDVLYLHQLAIITKPNLLACVVHTLPSEIMADNLDPMISSAQARATPQKNKASLGFLTVILALLFTVKFLWRMLWTGKQGEAIVEAIKELTNSNEKTSFNKRQIEFADEELQPKRQRNSRQIEEHAVAISAARLKEKKDQVELMMVVQRSILEL